VIGFAALLVVICLVVFFVLRSPNTKAPKELGPSRDLPSSGASPSHRHIPLRLGDIVVFDPSGSEVARWRATICATNRVALPASALFGGSEIVFQSDNGEVTIERGSWASGDPVALLHVEPDNERESPRLVGWKQNAPLFWRSLQPDSVLTQTEVKPSGRSGSLVRLSLPEGMKDPGVFVQEDRLVGWTFGDGIEWGYLWTRTEETGLGPGITIDGLVAALSTGRESDFSRALAGKGTRPTRERLEIFAQGFLRPRLLADEDVPSPLRDRNAASEMHALAEALLKEGRAKDVVHILDLQVIMESSDPLLVQDAVRAMVASKDYYRGIQYLESMEKEYFSARGQSLPGLEQFHSQLYKDWLREIIAKGGYFSAMAAFEAAKKAFPDDPEIHLLGVEAAMAEDDWGRAQELLQARDYPPSLKDRAMQLQNRVKEGGEESTALVIRFTPGESRIPVYADINSRLRLKLLIDTGAEVCTIPTSALERLGIETNDRTAVTIVQGVAGMDWAYQITLESVALDGWSVKDVRAVVLDLASDPDCGLLGLNFLNQFRYEIDNTRGILRLKRKSD
jgi:clan AA aspartic protease (TIGR02281 family)